jgi:hypothetical protein
MSILRSIDIDKVFDSMEISIDEHFSDIFSASVDKDLIPLRYELQNLRECKRVVFVYEFEADGECLVSENSLEIPRRGKIIKQIDYTDKAGLLEKLETIKQNISYNKENVEVIKFIVNNLWKLSY